MNRRGALLSIGAMPLAGTPAVAGPSTFASDWGARARRGAPAPLPAGYSYVGQRLGVPPIVLYGVALQESMKLFGDQALPWPWTLNVQGRPERHATFAEAVAALDSRIARGIRNVDAGLMQVNWGYHRDKLLDARTAVDPYPNMIVGARILKAHFDATGDWNSAIGRYHSPGNAQRAAAYAALVQRRIAQVPSVQPLGKAG